MMPSRTVADGPVCASHDPEIWFDAGRRREAVELCGRCPLRAECLVEALQLDFREREHGVWGGMVPAVRHKFKVRNGNVTVSYARHLIGAIA